MAASLTIEILPASRISPRLKFRGHATELSISGVEDGSAGAPLISTATTGGVIHGAIVPPDPMKAALFLTLAVSLRAQATFDVTTYGATGNGTTDDRAAIQLALDAAYSSGDATLYFPLSTGNGTYLLSSATLPGTYLAGITDFQSIFKINITCDAGVVIETSVIATPYMFGLLGGWRNSTITGCHFLNTHGLTTSTTGAILLEGGGGQIITGAAITADTFENFSRGVAVSGVTGGTLSYNSCLMDHGRDSGTSTNLTEPNVCFWLFDNSPNGTSIDIDVANNTYDGCVSGPGTASNMCGDGLVLAQGDQLSIQGNNIKHFSFEGIYIESESSQTVAPTIQSNIIDGTLVSGDINYGGQWGIRCDADNATITLNSVKNALNGIMIYGYLLPHDVTGATISSNTIFTTNSPQPFAAAIIVVGASNISITGNAIDFVLPWPTCEVFGIYVSGLVSRSSTGNTVTGNTVSKASGNSGATGIFLQWTSGWTIDGDTLENLDAAFHLMNLSGALSVPASLVSGSIISNDLQDAVVTNGTFCTSDSCWPTVQPTIACNVPPTAASSAVSSSAPIH